MVLGLRPTAHSTESTPSSDEPSEIRTVSAPPHCSSRSILASVAPVLISIPSAARAAMSSVPSISSKARSTRSRRSTMTTSLPSARSIPASSTAMYPLPVTTVRRGHSSSSKKPSEVIPSSAPGVGGTEGTPPVATTTWSAVRRTPPASTVRGPTKRAVPS